MGGKRTLTPNLLVRIDELPDLDGTFIEIVEQARINAHLVEMIPMRVPVGAAAADWTMVNADHSIAPDIGCRLTGNAYLVRWKIGRTPCEPATEGAVTVCNPLGLVWQFDPHVAAVAASLNAHNDM